MTDIVVVVLLLIVIALLVSMIAPEFILYCAMVGSVIVLIILLAILISLFLNDPVGFIWEVVVNNPVNQFANTTMSALPVIK